MNWVLLLVFIFGGLIFLMAIGMPVAFSFMLLILIAAPLVWGGLPGLEQVVIGMANSVVTFTLLPLPLFILMGTVIYHSGIAPLMIDTVDKWLGRLRGRLGLVAVGSGVLLATLTGSSVASVAMLGSTLVPEMEKRGYKKLMSLGPIMGSGGLAAMIPPSSMAVLVGAIGEISVGSILMAIIPAGILLALLYSVYIITICNVNPSLAPSYEPPRVSLSVKLVSFARYILPVGFVIFMVVGVMLAGVATPSEAAATGAISTFILAAFYKKLNWGTIKVSLVETLHTSVMMLTIMAASQVFSQILSFSGAAFGLAKLATGVTAAPIVTIIIMMLILIILGMFIDAISIMMITLPIFVPIVIALNYNPVWFAVLFMVNMEMAMITPPVGFSLYTMKGVAPKGTTIGDVIKAAMPFVGIQSLAMTLIIIFPSVVLWLPKLMR